MSCNSSLIADGHGGVAGYLRVGGEELALRVTRPSSADAGPLVLEAGPTLRAMLLGHEDAVEQRLRRSADATSFVSELAELLERVGPSNALPAALPPARFYELVIHELDAIGWGSLLSLSAELDSIQLLVHDAAGRPHTLGLTMPADYPSTPPTTHVAMPTPFVLRWPAPQHVPHLLAHAPFPAPPSMQHAGVFEEAAPSRSLASIIEQFRRALAEHQLLWDMLDDIDEHTWVLEPRSPSRDATSRRIAIGSHCSLQLELHVSSPASLPKLQFLGADRVIVPLRQALNANLSEWRHGRSARLNLEAVLKIQFPRPQEATAADAEQYAVECAICYSYHLDGAVPECACDGCSKPYHKACLAEWLRGLATTQQSFNRLFGECPFCTHPIAVEATAMG